MIDCRLSARSVIIADVCDTEYEALTTRRMKEVWGDKYGHSLPAYLHIGAHTHRQPAISALTGVCVEQLRSGGAASPTSVKPSHSIASM